MLLSIDRVLQLLAEGKGIDKIADLAEISTNEVVKVIEDARKIIHDYNKPQGRKKIILKKTKESSPREADSEFRTDVDEIFQGAELTAVPVGSSLTMYVDGASQGNPGPSGIGVVIQDNDDRQVGKVSFYIGNNTNNFAEYTALIRALKIALYFKTKVLKIRTDSELVVKQLNGEYKVKHEKIRVLYEEAVKLIRMLDTCKIEHVTRNFNDKADYLAKKAASFAQ